jgi:hypothetical protein
VADVVILINKDFVKLVLLALVIGTPLAWWLTNRWLQDFAYRTPVPVWIIPAAGSGAILIALLRLGFNRSGRPALSQPGPCGQTRKDPSNKGRKILSPSFKKIIVSNFPSHASNKNSVQ